MVTKLFPFLCLFAIIGVLASESQDKNEKVAALEWRNQEVEARAQRLHEGHKAQELELAIRLAKAERDIADIVSLLVMQDQLKRGSPWGDVSEENVKILQKMFPGTK